MINGNSRYFCIYFDIINIEIFVFLVLGDARIRGDTRLTIHRCTISTTVCAYPTCNQKNELHTIPVVVRKKILEKLRFYLPKLLKACEIHLVASSWLAIDPLQGENIFTAAQIEDMVDLLRLQSSKMLETSSGNMSISYISVQSENKNKSLLVFSGDLKDAVKRNTGLTLDQFEDLIQKLTTLHNTFKIKARAPTALYMYLMKMRTNLPSEDIGRMFQVSRTTADRLITKARNAMKSDFATQYVNYQRSRDEIIQLNTEMGRGLFCDGLPHRAVIVCDGTYIFIEKSRNYAFQKSTYNDQKKSNFVKIMMCVTCDGTIIYALGPYPAVQNDASILKSIIETTDAFDYFQENDVIILDRGFRDCISFVRSKGFDVRMPDLIQRSDTNNQLSTIAANRSRLVTAIRFVVEARNGHLKTIFKIFRMKWNPICLKHLEDDIEVCSALINNYFQRIESNKGIEDEIIQRMLTRLNTPNKLAEIVLKQAFQKEMKHFILYNDFDSLPFLTELQLIFISLGRYQIQQAESYCQEHMRENDSSFILYSFPENKTRIIFEPYYEREQRPILLYASLKSRFRGAKKHRTFVMVDLNGRDEAAVLGYCCECYHGLRTVGCCSHVMTIIWFTLFIKNNNIPRPAAFLDHYFNNILQ